jgi:hypothetical protein
MATLSEELRGEELPPYRVTVPVGWVEHPVSESEQRRMLAQARQRLMSVNRPDLYAQTMTMVESMFERMRRTSTVGFFMPETDAPDEARLPASLTVSVVRGRDGATLDEEMTQLIRDRGATSLQGDKRFVRYEQDRSQQFEGVRLNVTTVVYLTPVPGSGRRRALQFTLTVPRPIDEPADAPLVRAVLELFDAHVSTFAWERRS